MIWLLFTLIRFVAPAFACPDVDGVLNAAVQDILAADNAGSDADFAAYEQSLGCQTATSAQIARYLVLRGAAAELSSAGSGELLLASAHTLDPTVWEPQLGFDLKGVWAAHNLDTTGTLILDTNADGGWVDGQRVESWPVLTFAGWHAVQVISLRGGSVMYGRLVNLPSGENSLVATGLPESGAMTYQETAEATSLKKRRLISPAWLVASAVSAAAGGGLALGAKLQSDRIPQYSDIEGVDAAWLRERELAYGAYAAFGVAGVCGGLSFVLP